MVAAMLAALFERGIDSGPFERGIDPGPASHLRRIPHDKAVALRVVTTVCACISILADSLALAWFMQMKRKFRHSLILTLILADLLKDLNWVAFSIVTFVSGDPSSASSYCQASGFITHTAIEITDLSVLVIVIHMSLQVLNPNFAAARLDRFRHTILTLIYLLAIFMSALPFVNHDDGYQLTDAFCVLPARPLWYRLALEWIERYIIAVVIVALTVVIRYKVKDFQQTLARLQANDTAGGPVGAGPKVIPESDEADSGFGQEDGIEMDKENEQRKDSETENDLETEANDSDKSQVMPDTVRDDERSPFHADSPQRSKGQSYRVKRQTNAFENPSRVVSMAVSAAPSSAIFSPYRDSFRLTDPPQSSDHDSHHRSASAVDVPTRRQSVAVISGSMRGTSISEMPRRRASLIDAPTAPNPVTARSSVFSGDAVGPVAGDRLSIFLAPPARRASIWDEIDASLDKKFANNRVSVLSLTPSQTDFGTIQCPSNPATCTFPSHPKRASVMVNPSISDPTVPDGPTTDRRRKRAASFRNSRVYDRTRRTMSIISRLGSGEGSSEEACADSAAVILARRHRYIQRQMRYLILYPIVYLGLWLCPFLLHCLQYSDRLAPSPPYALVVLTYISLCTFGFANSLVFCLREKPWTCIASSDGTLRGSLRPGRILSKLGLGQRINGGVAEDEPSWVA